MADQALENRAPNSVSDLNNLAKQIDAAHVAVLDAAKAGVQRAAEAGHVLAQAKEQVPFGQWETWVAENTAVSPRTARGYMQVARYWLEATKAKRRALAVLGLQGLLAQIAKPHHIPAEYVEPEDPAAAPAEPRTIAVQFRVEDVVSGPKTIAVPASSAPALDQTEEPERAGDPEQERLSAIMKGVREAEQRSAAPRESRFNKVERLEIRRSENLDAAKRAYLRLDKADRQEFLDWTTEADPDYAHAKIIDMPT